MELPYFKLKEAFAETRNTFSYGSGSDKLSAVVKLVGKSAANVGMLAAEVSVEAIKRAPEIAGQMAKKNLDRASSSMTGEQRNRAEEIVAAGTEARNQRLRREREEESRQQDDKKE